MIAVILAVPTIDQEPDLVRESEEAGVSVVRRCVDAADLLAAAAVAREAVVVVSAALPRLSHDTVDRLIATSHTLVGLADAPADEVWLTDLGVHAVVRAGATAASTWRTIVGVVVQGSAARPPSHVSADSPSGVWASGCWLGDADAADASAAQAPGAGAGAGVAQSGRGSVVAVWGPQGAPGRTSVSIALADAIAGRGRTTCLVDADTYAPSINVMLGLDPAAADIIVACRCVEGVGSGIGPPALRTLARPIRGGLAVLAGLPTSGRWGELRPAALDRLWHDTRRAFDSTVVDTGFCIERTEEPSPLDEDRNAAAITALAAADVVVVVVDASALGIARIGSAWPAVSGLIAGRPYLVVRNRATAADRDWHRALRGCGLTGPVVDLPLDDGALAACWRHGRTLAEAARRSRLRRAVERLADACLAAPTGGHEASR